MKQKDRFKSTSLTHTVMISLGIIAGLGGASTAQGQTVVNNNVTGHAPDEATQTTTADPQYLHPPGSDGQPGTVDDQFYLTDGSILIGAADPEYSNNEEGITGFSKENSQGAFSPAGNIPVTRSYLEAFVNGDQAVVEWGTAQETNNAFFRVYEKLGNGDRELLEEVIGVGTTTQPQSYSVTDRDLSNNPNPATYTLEQVDTDGTTTYFGKVSVEYASDAYFGVRPNPTPGGVPATLDIDGMEEGTYKLNIVDPLGRSVYTEKVDIRGNTDLSLPTDRLSSGMYFVQLQGESGTDLTDKFTVVR